jgi:hypothetical protein
VPDCLARSLWFDCLLITWAALLHDSRPQSRSETLIVRPRHQLKSLFGQPYIHLLHQASRIVVFVAYRVRPSWSWRRLVLSRPHDEWVDMFQPRMIGRILAESTMAKVPDAENHMRLYEVLKTRHCADFEPLFRRRVQEKLNEEPLLPSTWTTLIGCASARQCENQQFSKLSDR